jgi:excisionase family DNA binding protein
VTHPNSLQPPPPEFLTSAEVSRMFGVDRRTVARWARTGKLNAIRSPGGLHYRFRADHIRVLLAAGPRP